MNLMMEKIFKFLNKECKHDWIKKERSNVLQLDHMGYPLRLFICECSKCGKMEQRWIDVSIKELEELETEKSVLLKWNEGEKYYE